nr:MAG: hypothetical protein DIU56_14545 [Pseudomonadota bacterium]
MVPPSGISTLPSPCPRQTSTPAAMVSIDEPVHLVDYDESWASAFSEECDRLAAALNVPRGHLEHIGSTAVRGLLAKPVIEIMLGVERWPPDDTLIEAISRAGYEFLGEAGVPERFCFRLRGPTSFNLHVVRLYGDHWRSNLALRDYLRGNEAARARYAREKRKVFSSNDISETMLVRDALEHHGIAATILNENLARTEVTVFRVPAEVWVFDDSEYENAARIVAETLRTLNNASDSGTWICPTCREENPQSFELCWSCGRERKRSPDAR